MISDKVILDPSRSKSECELEKRIMTMLFDERNESLEHGSWLDNT